MRSARALAALVLVLGGGAIAGCSSDAPDGSGDLASTPFGGGDGGAGNIARKPQGGSSATGDGGTASVAPDVDPATATHPEVVYVLMQGKDSWIWFCTGTLVAQDVVVTAAHCLQSSLFVSWEVLAPAAPGAPRVKASKVAMFDPDWSDVGNPDVGIVKLASPIPLSQYAVLTDVSARVDAGQQTLGAAIVRKAEEPEAPFMKTASMKLSSTVSYGYTHGYGVPLFSHGGDSGAGIFLVENGQMTHRLIAVERQPEPSRKLDHLTRVEPAFASWVAKQ